jgi:rRNA biogenesis protein RRP5
MSDEISFPRGGSNGGVVEKKSKAPKKEKVKKEKKKKIEEEDVEMDVTPAEAAALKGLAMSAPKFIPLLRYTALERSMQILGAVREVHELHALVALPNGLKGKLNITEFSDTLTEHIQKSLGSQKDDDSDSSDDGHAKKSSSSDTHKFSSTMSQLLSVGQIIRVASLTSKETTSSDKQVELTTRESILNEKKDVFSSPAPGTILAASIKSVEDHGYTISTGLPDTTGFLPFSNITKGTKFSPGGRVDLTVVSFKSNVFTFNYDAKASFTPVTSANVVTVDSLTPGMLVKAKIGKILKDGLWLQFLDYFSGTVDIHHVSHTDKDAPLIFGTENELQEWFSEGNTISARILHINPESKRIALSLLPHILSLTAVQFPSVKVGDRIENGEIRRVDEKGGLALVFPVKANDDSDATISFRGYVPLAKISDTKKDRVSETHYEIGTTKKVRVFGFNLIEGFVLLSHRKSDWKDPYLSYSDVKVGEIVEGTIKSVNSKGAVVTLSTNVEAFCPRTHLSDVDVTDPESRFKPGSSIKARVLRVSPEEHNAFVTFKKTLVKSTLEIVSDYKASAGIWTHGTVLSILPTGLLIMFYNDVKGFVPLHELNAPLESSSKSSASAPEAILKQLRTLYKIGQVVKCRVVEANPSSERMTVSFSSTVSATQTEKDDARNYISTFKVGQRIKNLEVVKREDIGLMLKYKDEKQGVSVPVLIPVQHLSDHKDLAKLMLETFKVGQMLDSLFIIARRRNILIGTLKASLLNAHAKKQLPFAYDQVKEGGVYSGYITKFFDSGVIVRFGDEFCGFAPRGQMAHNHHIANLQTDFYDGQSVIAEVASMDAGKMQITVTLKSEACKSKDASYLDSYFTDLQNVTKKKKDIDWSKYSVGSVIKTKVKTVETWGITLTTSDSQVPVGCFVHPTQFDGSSSDYTVGASYQAVILDINYQKAILDVSLRSDLVTKASQTKPSSSKKALVPGTAVESIIELVKRDYIILSTISKDSLRLILAPARDFNTEGFIDPFQRFKALSTVTATIDSKSYNGIHLATLVEKKESSEAKKGSASTFQSDTIKTLADVKIGQSLDAMVLVIHAHRIELSLGGRVKGFLDITAVQDIDLPKKGCNLSALHASSSNDIPKKSSKKSSSGLPSQLASELAQIKLPSSHPFALYKAGQVVKGLKVSSFTECKSDGSFVEGLQSIPKQASDDASVSSKFQVQLSTRKTEPPTFKQLTVGSIVPFWINQITSTSLNGFVGRNLRAYCSALESSHSPSVASSLSAHFKIGQVVLAAVTELEKDKQKVQLSIRAIHVENGVASTPSTLKVGDVTMVRVSGFKMPFLRVQAFDRMFGRIFVTDLSDAYDEKPLETWTAKEGQLLEAKLVSLAKVSTSPSGSDDTDTHPTFTLRKSQVSSSTASTSTRSNKSSSNNVVNPRIASYEDVAPGLKLSGYISKHVSDKRFCFVHLGDGVVGHLPYSVIGETFTKDPVKKYPVGTLVSGTVLKVDAEKKRIDFAMRERQSKEASQAKVTFDNLEVGNLVKGVVNNIQAFGVFIKINKSNVSALCHVSLLKDNTSSSKQSRQTKKEGETNGDNRLTLEQVQAMFKIGDKVTAVVHKKDEETKKMTLSMKASDILKAKKNTAKMDSDESQDSSASSSSESKSKSSSSSSSGSGSDEEESDDDDEMLNKALQKKSKAKKRKASDLPSASDSSSDSDENVSTFMQIDGSKKKKKASVASTTSVKKAKLLHDEIDSSEEHISMHPGNDIEDDDSDASSDSSRSVSGSESGEDDVTAEGGLSSGVQWDDLKFKSSDAKKSGSKDSKPAVSWSMDVDEDEALKSDSEADQPLKKSKKPKTAKEEMLEEAKVTAKERSLLGENQLENDADFERALMSTPNSSYVWVRWIAQKIHEGDVPKARDTAEKALRKIDDREDDEKFNVWVFYLNLENQYGTRESFSILLRRAAHSSKPKPIYSEAIKMLLKADRRKEAEDIYQLILRKYKHCMSSWVNWATYHFEINKAEQARDIFNKSLKSLVPRKHLPTLTKFAQLEFRLGDSDRGRTIFETLLGNHPKRTDIWFVYADMELKYGKDEGRVRQIYERMISLDLNPTKMKPIFKRYLTFEATHGTPDTVSHVKSKASDYIAIKSKE